MHRWKDVGHGTSPEVKTLLKGEQTESWAKAGRGSKPPGPPAPVDTHAGVQKGGARELPFQTWQSISEEEKGSCRRARKAAFEAAAGRAMEWAGAVCSPTLWLTGNPVPL